MKTLKISLLAFGVVISMNESAVAATRSAGPYQIGFNNPFTPAGSDVPYETTWSKDLVPAPDQNSQRRPSNIDSGLLIPNGANFTIEPAFASDTIYDYPYNSINGNYTTPESWTNPTRIDYNFQHNDNLKPIIPGVVFPYRSPGFLAVTFPFSFGTARSSLIYHYNNPRSGEFFDSNKHGNSYMVYTKNTPWTPGSETYPSWMSAWGFHMHKGKPRGLVQGVGTGEFYWRANDGVPIFSPICNVHSQVDRRVHGGDYTSYPFLYKKTTFVAPETGLEFKTTPISQSPSRKKSDTGRASGVYDNYKTVYVPTETRSKPSHK